MPCRIVADSQRTTQLDSGNTSFVRCAQIDSPEPEGQRQTGMVHDGSSSNRGLVPAGAALVGVAALDGIVFHATTLGAYEPLGKTQTEQFCSACVFAVVTTAKFLERDLSCTCHDNVPFLFWERSGNIIACHLSNNLDFFEILWLAELSR